jgi:hypothetical protein
MVEPISLLLLRGIDQEWLDAVNVERRNEQIDKISYELFEIIIDRLEKEWFDLVCYRHSLSCKELSENNLLVWFSDEEHPEA